MRRAIPLAMLLLLPGAALAHPGHETGGIVAGIAHPLGGADHLLAMLALGALAAQAGGRALWLLPAVFVGSMLAGGAAGWAGLPFTTAEPAILASVIVLGALLACAVQVPLAGLVGMAAVFGIAHGWAHGAEGPAAAPEMLAYAVGFAVATALLHAAGILAVRSVAASVLRAAGAATAAAGVMLAAL